MEQNLVLCCCVCGVWCQCLRGAGQETAIRRLLRDGASGRQRSPFDNSARGHRSHRASVEASVRSSSCDYSEGPSNTGRKKEFPLGRRGGSSGFQGQSSIFRTGRWGDHLELPNCWTRGSLADFGNLNRYEDQQSLGYLYSCGPYFKRGGGCYTAGLHVVVDHTSNSRSLRRDVRPRVSRTKKPWSRPRTEAFLF